MSAPDAAHEARERIDLGAGYALEPDDQSDATCGAFYLQRTDNRTPRVQFGRRVGFFWDCPETRAFAAAMQAREARIAELEAALQDVLDPIGRLRRRADAEGSRLNGMAYQIANSVSFLQDIARAALATASQSEHTS